MVRVGASVDCEQVFSAVVYIAVHANVARNAYRAAATAISPEPNFSTTTFTTGQLFLTYMFLIFLQFKKS